MDFICLILILAQIILNELIKKKICFTFVLTTASILSFANNKVQSKENSALETCTVTVSRCCYETGKEVVGTATSTDGNCANATIAAEQDSKNKCLKSAVQIAIKEVQNLE